MPNQIKDILNFLKAQGSVKLALIGLVGAILFSCTKGSPILPPPQHLANPSVCPYEYSISGNGYVEANTRNISVGSFTSGIVSRVFVHAGDRVTSGQPLFEIDKRSAEAQMELDTLVVETAKHNADAAEAQRMEAADQHQRATKMKDGYMSAEEAKKREFALQQLQAQSYAAQTRLKEAEHRLQLSKIALSKLTILAPVEGLICKVNVRAGEYVSETFQPQGCVIMGNDKPLHIRAQIDEHDAWRLSPQAAAVAFLPGCGDVSIPLTFVRLEPYAGPKQQLSGNSKDVIDTRVVEVVYATPQTLPCPLYIGQQVDVFIDDKSNKK